jgi:hypothetical protein
VRGRAGPLSPNVYKGAKELTQTRAKMVFRHNGISQMRKEERKLRAVGSMEQAQGAEAKSASRNAKLGKLIEYLKSMTEGDFTGYVKINFTQGNIGRVEKFEEILRK